MSDYLSELAARSLESTEVIQPRLASRFEPVVRGGALDRALGGRGPADAMNSVADFPVGVVTPPGSREQPPAVLAQSGQSSAASRAARLSQGEPEAQTADPRRTPDAQSPGLETIVTLGSQLMSKPSRSEEMSRTDDNPGRIQSPSLPSMTVAASAQQPGAAGSVMPQTSLSAQPPIRPLSGQDEHGFDERIRSAVGDALALQRPSKEMDGSGPEERNNLQPLVGSLFSQDDRSLDGRIRSAIDDALAMQRIRKEAEDSAHADHGGVQVGGLEQLSAEDRAMPSRKESAPQVQPAALVRVITQPQVVIAAPARPASLERAAAEKPNVQPVPQPAPTIQVTIGRIEVRATPAPTSGVTSKPRQAPAMSLDDYLRQRNRGGQ
jgi:hypothetical protein